MADKIEITGRDPRVLALVLIIQNPPPAELIPAELRAQFQALADVWKTLPTNDRHLVMADALVASRMKSDIPEGALRRARITFGKPDQDIADVQ